VKSLLFALALTLGAGSASAQIGPVAPPAPSIAAARDVPYPGTIRLQVDASDVERRIWRVRQAIPVAQPGPMTLLYPQWLPGNHAPRGPVERLAGLEIRAGGRLLNWTRDPVHVHAFHVDVPAGARELDVSFQHVTPTEADQGRIVVTPEMLNLQWNLVVLYPAGHYAGRITVEPTVTLPAKLALRRGAGARAHRWRRHHLQAGIPGNAGGLAHVRRPPLSPGGSRSDGRRQQPAPSAA
jgi:hypothetical protein